MTEIDRDLVDQISQEFSDVEQGDDLLGQIPEEDGEPWIPEVAGEGVQGVVVSYDDTMPDEFKADETVPVVVLRTADGTLVRITGFHGVLRKELRKCRPQRGDQFAVRFMGEQTLKRGPYKGNTAYIYRAAIQRNPHSPTAA